MDTLDKEEGQQLVVPKRRSRPPVSIQTTRRPMTPQENREFNAALDGFLASLAVLALEIQKREKQ